MPIPPKDFLFIRHAQTEANHHGIMAGGDTDIPINATGKKQAASIGDCMHPRAMPISKVYCSPMLRTQQTAELILKNYEVEIELVEGLREWRAGDWEGVAFHELPRPGSAEFDPPGGESQQQFSRRMLDAFVYILSQADPNPLVVAHGGIWHELVRELAIQDSGVIENAHLIKVYYQDQAWHYRELLSLAQRDAQL